MAAPYWPPPAEASAWPPGAYASAAGGSAPPDYYAASAPYWTHAPGAPAIGSAPTPQYWAPLAGGAPGAAAAVYGAHYQAAAQALPGITPVPPVVPQAQRTWENRAWPRAGR